MQTGFIGVEGLRELSRDLRNVGHPRLLSRAHRELSRRVALEARRAALAQGGVAAKSAPAIRWVGGATRAGVRLDASGRYPFAFGAEFGSVRYPQFKPWRGSSSGAGYFLYPTIRRELPKAADDYLDTLEAVLSERTSPRI